MDASSFDLKDARARLNERSSGSTSSGFDFMEDRPMHTRGRPIGSGGGGGGNRSAPARLSVHGKSRVASLFDLLQELSVPPKPQSSSHGGARAPGAPGALPSTAVSASPSKPRPCSETTGRGEQHQQAEASSQEPRKQGGAGGGGPRSGSTSASGQQEQIQQAIRRDSDSLHLPPRPVLRRVRLGHNQQGVSRPQPVRRVTFVEESKEDRRLGDGEVPSGALSRPSLVSHVAGALGTGTGGSGSGSSQLAEGSIHPHAKPSPARDTAAKRKSAALGTIEPDNSNARGVVMASSVTRRPGAARTAAAVGFTTATPPKGLPQERLARRRRVDGGGRPGSGRDGRGDGGGGGDGGGESSRRVVALWSTPSGGRESDGGRGINTDGDATGHSSSSSSWRGSLSSAQGGKGGGRRGGGVEDGGGGWISAPDTGQQEEGGHDWRVVGQTNKGACSRRRMPQEPYDALQWMTQGPDRIVAVDHPDGGSRRQSPTTPESSGDSGSGRDGTSRASKHTVLQQQQQQEEEEKEEGGTVHGYSSGQWRGDHASRRYASPRYDEGTRRRRGEGQGALQPVSPEASPQERGAGEEAERAVEAADDDGTSSSGDEGYTYHDGGDQDGDRGSGGASDQAQERKEMLGVRGLCLMKGTLLAMVDWSTPDGGTERTIMPTSELKAEWPRQYIAYLEAKLVFTAEEGRPAPDNAKDGHAG